MRKNKIWIILGFTAVAAGTVFLLYALANKFINDRIRLMYGISSLHHVPLTLNAPNQPTHAKRTYTAKEWAEAKRKGQLPPDVRQPYTPPNTAGQDAVQRSLKTIEDINRINQMNQRLLEQQQRLQKNK